MTALVGDNGSGKTASSETSALLAWFPGKDLMAALAPWLEARHLVPDRLRVRLRD